MTTRIAALAVSCLLGCATAKTPFRDQRLHHCYRTDNGLDIAVMQTMTCPPKDKVEFNERAWRRLLKVKPHEVSNYTVVLTDGRIIGCGGRDYPVEGCSDVDVAYVNTEHGWVETMKTFTEELSHRLCYDRYQTMDPKHEKPCYLTHKDLIVWPGPQGYWHSH